MSPRRRTATRVQVARRRAEAVQLRVAGATWEEIAARLGYASRGAACTDVTRALAEAQAELNLAVSEWRQLHLARLEAAHRVAAEVMARDHVHVSHGRIVREGVPAIDDQGQAVIREGHGSPVLDDGPKLAAIDRVVKVSESVRKLLGHDAQTKLDASVSGDLAPMTFNINLDGAEQVHGQGG
ncbi:hypothetical protein [Saccharothrix lopnurensis]|uniref:Helix-turn-helix DNA binding domain protein n=1 Tax=Saccharothrix lopnurensis TaxID=1670621 RepID=A0ABW1P6K6_9PSEU